MGLRIQTKVIGTISVDDDEASILHHLCCYDLWHYFNTKCSQRITEEEFREKLKKLRHQFEEVLKTKRKVEEFLTGVVKP